MIEGTTIESPIEQIFAENLTKFCSFRRGVRVETQKQIPHMRGHFRVDFLVSSAHRAFAFECDGKAWHRDKLKDDLRDAIILGSGAVNIIYRATGRSLYRNESDVIYSLFRHERWAFTDRAESVLKRLRSNEDDHDEYCDLGGWTTKFIVARVPSPDGYLQSLYERYLELMPICSDFKTFCLAYRDRYGD